MALRPAADPERALVGLLARRLARGVGGVDGNDAAAAVATGEALALDGARRRVRRARRRGGVSLTLSPTPLAATASRYCGAVLTATEEAHDTLAEAATTALRLTALVLREDAVNGSQLPVATLRVIEKRVVQLPVPPLRFSDPPCEFEAVVDTIRATARARAACAQFLARAGVAA